MTTLPTPLGAILALMGACTMEARTVAAASTPACTLRHDAGGYTARITAAAPVTGSYALRLRGAGLAIDQSGDFAAGTGESVILGQARVPEVAQAELLVTIAGTTFRCPVEG